MTFHLVPLYFLPMTTRQVLHVESGQILIPQAKWCDGFTFRRELGPQDGLVLVETKDNRVNTAIHMLFAFFDLGVIWVNDAGKVVGTVAALLCAACSGAGDWRCGTGGV